MVKDLLFMSRQRGIGMKNRYFTMTMTSKGDRYSLCNIWGGHGGHGGHGVFTHTCTRARTLRALVIQKSHYFSCVYKTTMTTMTTMTRLVMTWSVAVIVGGHSKNHHDHLIKTTKQNNKRALCN